MVGKPEHLVHKFSYGQNKLEHLDEIVYLFGNNIDRSFPNKHLC